MPVVVVFLSMENESFAVEINNILLHCERHGGNYLIKKLIFYYRGLALMFFYQASSTYRLKHQISDFFFKPKQKNFNEENQTSF